MREEPPVPPPDPPREEAPLQTLSLVEHLLELRKRLMYICVALFCAFLVVYPFAQELFAFLVKPLATLMTGEKRRLIYTGLAEAFMTYLKVGFLGAFVLASPVVLAQVWLFISPGLYVHERRAALAFLTASPLLFLAGAALAYGVVCPLAWRFFLSFEAPSLVSGLPLQLEARVSEYLSLTLKMIFAFGLSFQLPILLMICAQLGLLQSHSLARQRKYAFLGIVVVAALITPPDLLSPLSLIVPIYGLYETSILLIRWREKASKKP